jgi:hypothetical protein
MTIRLGLSIRRRRLEEEWSKPDRSNPEWSAAYSQRLSSYPFLRSIQELRLLNTSLRASRPTIAIEMVPRQNSCSRSAAKSRVRQAQARLMNGFPSSVHPEVYLMLLPVLCVCVDNAFSTKAKGVQELR